MNIKNANGNTYHIIATNGEYSLIYGDRNYIIVSNINPTSKGYMWSQGKYYGEDFLSAVEYYKKKAMM